MVTTVTVRLPLDHSSPGSRRHARKHDHHRRPSPNHPSLFPATGETLVNKPLQTRNSSRHEYGCSHHVMSRTCVRTVTPSSPFQRDTRVFSPFTTSSTDTYSRTPVSPHPVRHHPLYTTIRTYTTVPGETTTREYQSTLDDHFFDYVRYLLTVNS